MGNLKEDPIDIFFDLLEEEYKKDFKSEFRIACGSGQRLGQAFFNVLPSEFQAQLRGSLYDPFHHNGWGHIFRAVDFLTTK